jgi:CheY-like chemotaxis protein
MMPTALIVEDEPAANNLLARLIQLRGYKTLSAFTGGEALDAVARESPDVVFLDLMLPDLDGYEVCKSIKSRPATARIPVVMVTARVALENRLRSFRVGADQYIPKPYTPDQIFEALTDADALQRQSNRSQPDGDILFETDEDGETLRRLAHLRSLLFAVTPLDAEAVERVFQAFAGLWELADAWGRDRKIGQVATLHFHVYPDCAVFTLRDESGWFRDDPRPAAERWPFAFASGTFDEVDDEPAGSVWIVRFPAAAPQ